MKDLSDSLAAFVPYFMNKKKKQLIATAVSLFSVTKPSIGIAQEQFRFRYFVVQLSLDIGLARPVDNRFSIYFFPQPIIYNLILVGFEKLSFKYLLV